MTLTQFFNWYYISMRSPILQQKNSYGDKLVNDVQEKKVSQNSDFIVISIEKFWSINIIHLLHKKKKKKKKKK